MEVIEASAAGVLELGAGVSARVVEPPGGGPHPEHGAARGRGRRETLLRDLRALAGTEGRGRGGVVRPGEDRGGPGLGAAGAAELVITVRTVRVAVTPHAGGQQQASAGGLAEEVIRGLEPALNNNNNRQQQAESEYGGREGRSSAHPVG